MRGTLGSTYIDTILGEYVPIEETNGPIEELLTDETDQLLYAVLTELRAQRIQSGNFDIQTILRDERQAEQSGVDSDATYETEVLELSALDDDDDWQQLDLDFVSHEVDLRFDDDIYVAFKQQFGSEDVIPYSASDSPVVGIPASTSWISVVAQPGTGGATINIEAWGDAS